MDIELQTKSSEDAEGRNLLREVLEASYSEGWNDATDGEEREVIEAAPSPEELWEKLMKIVGVIV